MGCGKTVITAHIVEELIHKNKNKIPRRLMCYHYCVDDETGQAVYIYASLILQLLDQQEGFKVEFDKWYDDMKRNELRDPAQCSTDLANFFSKCVSTLDRELFIVIDGLNECDSKSQHELVTMLQDVSKRTPRLKVFISSQCQERIEKLLHGTSQIRWNPSPERDMIIAQHTVERCLSGLRPDIQSLVTERLSQMAQGSAIWIKLIVELILKRNIKAKGSMRAFLRDMPSSNRLSQLYAKLFVQLTGDDPDNELLATNALEILAVARRPLSILELGWALALMDPSANPRTMEELEDGVDAYRALGLLQPLLSQVDFEDVRGSQVRLVHQSLKLLILRDAPSTWPELRHFTETSRPDIPGVQQRQCKLESALLHACVKYLLLNEIDEMDLFSKEQEAAQTLQALPGTGLFDDFSNEGQQPDSFETNGSPQEGQRKADQLCYDPSERGFGEFFIYASCFWLDHLKTSAPERLPDTSDLVKLCRAKSKRLHNWIGQNCRPDCTILPKFDHDSELQDPLVLISLYGPEIALKKLLKDYDVCGKDFLTDSVKQAIWQTISYGDLSRLEILFKDTRVRLAVRNMNFFRHLMGTWAQSSERDSTQWMNLFDLFIGIFDTLDWTEDWGNEVLCVAVTFGCLPFIKKLFEKAATNPEMRQELLQDRRRDYHRPDHHQSVGEAA